MRKPLLGGLTAGLIALSLTSVPASAVSHAAAGSDVVRPGTLAHGPHARVPWLIDNVVHTGAGAEVTLPWTVRKARSQSLQLVGHVPGGWLVKSFVNGDTWRLWAVHHGSRHPVTATSVTEGEEVDYLLSEHHTRVLVHLFDGDSTTVMSVRTLDDTTVDTQEFAGHADVLAFTGAEAVVGLTDTQRWDVDAHDVQGLGVDAAGADPAHDLLFVTDTTSGESGPTSLEDPGTPDWSAPLAQTVVSPGGGKVLARGERDGDDLVVRRVATGAERASFDVRFMTSAAPVWENNRSFVLLAYVGGLGDRVALVRCRLSGVCQRLSPIAPRDTISLPPV